MPRLRSPLGGNRAKGRSEPVANRAEEARKGHGFTGALRGAPERWSHFLRQPAKVDSLMQRTTHHEDAETVFG